MTGNIPEGTFGYILNTDPVNNCKKVNTDLHSIKIQMKFSNLLSFLFVILPGVLNAQTDFRPGYVIKAVGDTLYGEIDYRGDITMNYLCRFRICKDSAESRYSPNDIVAYRFSDDKYYISKKVFGIYIFLEYLVNGKISIYYSKDSEGKHYYIEKDDLGLSLLPYEEGIRYIDHKPYDYQSTQHMRILRDYMQDAPQLRNRIRSLRKPGYRNLIKLAEEYQNTVSGDEKCTVYAKKIPFINLSFEPVMGMVKYNSSEKFKVEPGIFIYLWAPHTNEKIYFKTGVVYSRLKDEGKDVDVYKIPFQIQYLYPRGIIRPKLSVGFNFCTLKLNDFNNRTYTLSLCAGLDYPVSKNISMTTNFNADFIPVIYTILYDYKFSLVSYSFNVGVYITI